ncbi:hypothetical protein C7212DRAFT_345897 [Tuber magnatum]|uniref:Uncharacterized protein n=1 Tax=Tuber magnatum TaxID=42249 RepID=A0A317SJQ7_9PEZI|nr:hypothetical protein C7212DRAFT_345897 [Tuber magnatum]
MEVDDRGGGCFGCSSDKDARGGIIASQVALPGKEWFHKVYPVELVVMLPTIRVFVTHSLPENLPLAAGSLGMGNSSSSPTRTPPTTLGRSKKPPSTTTTTNPMDHKESSSSFVYKRYLHKLPHSAFFVVKNHSESAACMACDETPCMALNQCTKCDLQLCSACAFILVHGNCRGNLKRLIAQVARWKLGYSAEFLEREAQEERASRMKELERSGGADGSHDDGGQKREGGVREAKREEEELGEMGRYMCAMSDGRLWKDNASESSSDEESLDLGQETMEDSFETALQQWSALSRGRYEEDENYTDDVEVLETPD